MDDALAAAVAEACRRDPSLPVPDAEDLVRAVLGLPGDAPELARRLLDERPELDASWANAGVAPCLPGGFVAVTLKDDKGGIVAVMVDEGFDVRTLKVGPPDKAPATKRSSELTAGMIAPVTKPGEYDVFVSVGQRDGTPAIALPLANDDGQKRYKLGRITLKAE